MLLLKCALLIDVVFIAFFWSTHIGIKETFIKSVVAIHLKTLSKLISCFLSDKISIAFHTRVNCFDLCIIILQSVIRKRCQISISRAIGFTS